MKALSSLFILIVFGLALITDLWAGEIHKSVLDGNFESVKTIVGQHREVLNSLDERGKAALHYAIEAGHEDISEFLIEQGADISLMDQENRSPLHFAAAAGNVELARILLNKGTSGLNEASMIMHGGAAGGWTPLHLACLNGHPQMVSFLLDHGADIEARDGYQRTPLILTGQGKSFQVAKTLVERGADINAEAIRNYTALLWAARNDFEEMVNYLLDQGAVIAEDMLEPAFWFAVNNGLNRLFTYAEKMGIKAADFKDRDPGLIVVAAEGGSTDIIASLVQSGFDPRFTEEDGWTPLHYAASTGQTDVIGYLLNQSVDIDARTVRGETAFNLASSNGLTETAECLAKSGADTSKPRCPVMEGMYMGQTPPGDQPEMFMPGIVSGHYNAHSSITFSPDGREAYWTEMTPQEGGVTFMKVVDGRWACPEVCELDRDPAFSQDGKRIYFIRTRPFKPGEEPGGDPDVKEEYWYVERTDSSWSQPISTGDAVNTIGVHWPCSIDKDGNLFFSEFSENMYFSKYRDGEYQEPVNLKKHFDNETLIGSSPCISPDGGYLIFSAPDGLNISFRREDGTWTDRMSLGDEINASRVNGSPRVTVDGQYLFFVSAGQGRPWGIYWVSTSIIDRLKEKSLSHE